MTKNVIETKFADMHPHMQEAIVRQLQALNPNSGLVANFATKRAETRVSAH